MVVGLRVVVINGTNLVVKLGCGVESMRSVVNVG